MGANRPDSGGSHVPVAPSSAGARAAITRHATSTQQASKPMAPPAPVQRPKSPVARAAVPKVSTNSAGNYARPVAPPPAQPGPVMDINAYLNSDAGYQQQLREFAKAMQDFTADVTRRKGDLESNYGTSQRALSDQRGLDLKALQDDYGARGLAHSGLYADANAKYETEYNNRATDLGNQQNQALQALLGEQQQFQSAEDLKTQAAKEAAIRRRAEQTGV